MPDVTERFTAKVSVNDDPAHRGRIKVTCADLTGDPDTELPEWIEPVYRWGWFTVPDVDELVEIEVVTQRDSDEVEGQALVLQPTIHWREIRHYNDNEEQGAVRDVHEDFYSSNYGKRRGFATPKGHILMFDDTDGDERINLTWHAVEDEEDKYAYLSFDPTGSIIMGNKNGSLVFMDADNGAMSIIDEHGNTISSDKDGMRIIDKTGNVIDMKNQLVQVLGQGSVVVNAKTIDLQSGKVIIGKNAVQKAVLGDLFKTTFDTHTHPTGTGPSGPPTTPMPPTDLSQNAVILP